MAREDEIRLIAYHIWEEEGCPDGKDCDHWYMAESVWEEQQKPAATKKEPVTAARAPNPARATQASKKSPRTSAKR